MDSDEVHDDPWHVPTWEQPVLTGMEQYSAKATYTASSGVTVKGPGKTSYITQPRDDQRIIRVLDEHISAYFQQIMDRLDLLEDRITGK